MLAGKIAYFRPTGFDPRSISGLTGWYDFADSSTLAALASGSGAVANGGGVRFVRDKSSAQNNLTNIHADVSRPVFVENSLNGRSALTFDGGDILNGSQVLMTHPFSLFVVCRANVTGTSRVCGVSSTRSIGPFGASNTQWGFFSAGGIRSFGVSATAASVLALTCDASLGGAFYGNGTPMATAALSAVTPSGFALGNDVAAANGTYNGLVYEVIAYNSSLSATQVSAVTLYLAQKWGITLPPTASNADAQSWINRVYANGGTVSTSTANAVNTFCNSIDSAGIRSRFYRLNLFCGTGLASALVPLYRGQSLGGTQFGNATDTNNNFVAADYTETSGLIGNGSSKTLDTGLPQNFANGRHFGLVPHTLATSAFRYYMGAKAAGNNNSLWSVFSNSPTTQISAYTYSDTVSTGGAVGQSGVVVAVPRRLHIFTNASGSGGSVAYADGVRGGSDGFGFNTTSTVPVGIYGARQSDGTFQFQSNPRLSGYTIGANMTASEVASYNIIWTTLLTALGRS